MKRCTAGVLCLLLVAVAAQAQPATTVPTIPFESVRNPFKLPNDVHFGEVAGVATNSRGHVFVFSRGGNANGPAYMSTAAQLLEFDADGNYVREIGKGLYAWSYAHGVRVDRQDNIWVIDKGSDMIIKFNPEGHVEWVFGRKQEASHFSVPPDFGASLSGHLARAGLEVNPPKPNTSRNPVPVQRDGLFNQPTDVAFDAEGNIYMSDGYVNSRVAKVSSTGEWLTSWGTYGTGPGQFDTPHGVAVGPTGEVFVADRGNRRVQVFDPNGKYLREFTIDVPVPADFKFLLGYPPEAFQGGSLAAGAPDALCITPGPNPVLFVGDLNPGRVYKLTLQGELLGVYGRPGRNLGEFGWIHAIDCPSENEIWVGELLNWRVQKLVIPESRRANR